MTPRWNSRRGFSLIEMLVIIVVIGILAAVAMQSMTSTVRDIRQVRTEREMDMLAQAIVGDPALTQNHQRGDFGYVGDVGAFPSNLQALYQNPGGYATWNGPYLPAGYAQDSTGFKTDEWGALYSYAGGTTIISSGSGSAITKKIADATNDYLLNTISGTIMDAANEPPGATYVDSVNIVITYPNGAGSSAGKTYHPDKAGFFTLDSIPVGMHLLRVIYTPNVDTLVRYLTVLPRHRNRPSYRFASAYFGGGGSGPLTITLRPDGTGSLTNLTRSGCADNFQCVAEATADEDATIVIRASASYQTDVYTIEDPPGSSGTIQSVTVYCRARRTKVQGDVQPVVYVSSTEYRGTQRTLTDAYADYSDTWATNPNTGATWTWTDIINLQAGVRLKGQNAAFPGYCTQVRIEVEYTP